MVKNSRLGYVPDRGDIVWLNFDPSLEHEQRGKRPALVLSPSIYNGRSSLLLACPITTKIKDYPFEVPIEVGSISGAVLADQAKVIDWQARRIEFAAKVPTKVTKETINKLLLLLS